jgi:hypothetical protein
MSAAPTNKSEASDSGKLRDKPNMIGEDPESADTPQHGRSGTPANRFVRKQQTHHSGANSRCSAQQSQPPRPGTKNFLCVYREQRDGTS